MQTISGMPDINASTTAGNNSATAVPEVVTIATGCFVDFAIPSAKKADDLSSKLINDFIFLLSAKAVVNGVLREPGEILTNLTP